MKFFSGKFFSCFEDTSKNLEFAQMQGAEKISQRRIGLIC